MTDETQVSDTVPPRQSVAPGTSALPSELWQAVLEAWEDPKHHEALLLQCRTSAQLAAAAGNYRALLDDPARKALAETQLKRIAAAAMAQMEVSRATETRPPRSRLGWQLLLLVAFAIGTVLVLRQLSGS